MLTPTKKDTGDREILQRFEKALGSVYCDSKSSAISKCKNKEWEWYYCKAMQEKDILKIMKECQPCLDLQRPSESMGELESVETLKKWEA